MSVYRAMLIDGSAVYYVEQPSMTAGPLATTVCVDSPGPRTQKVS